MVQIFVQLTEKEWPKLEALPTSKNVETLPVLSTQEMLVSDTCNPIVDLEELIQCTRFSIFNRLMPVTACVLKVAKRLKQPTSVSTNLSCHPLKNSTLVYWVFLIQAKSFASEICYFTV